MRRLTARAVGAGAVALALTGCAGFPVAPMPYGYPPPRMGYAPSFALRSYTFRRAFVVPHPSYVSPPYVMPPGAVAAAPMPPYPQPAASDPSPLRSVDPPGYVADDSCVGWWRICHLF